MVFTGLTLPIHFCFVRVSKKYGKPQFGGTFLKVSRTCGTKTCSSIFPISCLRLHLKTYVLSFGECGEKDATLLIIPKAQVSFTERDIKAIRLRATWRHTGKHKERYTRGPSPCQKITPQIQCRTTTRALPFSWMQPLTTTNGNMQLALQFSTREVPCGPLEDNESRPQGQ